MYNLDSLARGAIISSIDTYTQPHSAFIKDE